jgi:alkylation response protein AidB-like acyl-CoA dehydrogenase
LLARFDSRAATYDRENRFFDQDFDELRAAKYLVLPVPAEFGGPGLRLAEVCREQRTLAYYAPATALAVNMHLYWVGVAADLWRCGDASLEWILRDAAAGEIFAAGHAESGNDIPVLLSTVTRAITATRMPVISHKTLSRVGTASIRAMAATACALSSELSKSIHLTSHKSGL